MQTGDLVYVVALVRGNSYNNITITSGNAVTGGQSWTTGTTRLNGSSGTMRAFWCRYNGTWAANPTVDFVDDVFTAATTVVMQVFRPTGTAYTWASDTSEAYETINGTDIPHTYIATGITTATDGALAIITAGNINDFIGAVSTNNWLDGGDFRNSHGTGTAIWTAYQVKASAGATGTASFLSNNNGAVQAGFIRESFKELAPASVKYLKLLAHPSAASASGIAGVVFLQPSGGDIVGGEIGEFTGTTFEATLEGGRSVLKVPVANFGGNALTTSDTPVAFVRNATFHTDVTPCTVIEE
jgi:hypothetical protein